MSEYGITWLKESSAEPEATSPQIRGAVAAIVEDIRARGMAAVREYAKKFDNHEGPFRVPLEEARRAADALDPVTRGAIERSIANVRKFHALQRETMIARDWEIEPGVRAGIRYVPIDAAGVYVPGGRYPLLSSAIMSVVPAREAGVRRVAAFSPPGRGGKIDGAALGALALLGVDEIWALGGVQAIAALALGVGDERERIEKADFAAGPGNAYVSEAKRALFGEVGIDGLAGPSEVLIIADDSADYRFTARDLLAQSEHDPMARGILISTSREFAEKARAELERILPSLPTRGVAEAAWRRNGAIGTARTLDDAIAYANDTAPEHLQLAIASPREALQKCLAYGAAFLGYSSCEVFGDYIAGTNHILPTSSRARFSAGLWTGSFLRPLTHLALTPQGAASLAPSGASLARAEGMEAHARALLAREEAF